MEHGPGMHGPVLLVLIAIGVLGGLVYLARYRSRSDKREDAGERSGEAREASDRRSDAGPATPDRSDPELDASDAKAGAGDGGTAA